MRLNLYEFILPFSPFFALLPSVFVRFGPSQAQLIYVSNRHPLPQFRMTAAMELTTIKRKWEKKSRPFPWMNQFRPQNPPSSNTLSDPWKKDVAFPGTVST